MTDQLTPQEQIECRRKMIARSLIILPPYPHRKHKKIVRVFFLFTFYFAVGLGLFACFHIIPSLFVFKP